MRRPTFWPLVINETPEVCPTCERSDALASVFRDMGTERWCTREGCSEVRWPNPNRPGGALKLARLREEQS